jgi:hypothetical protein
MSDDADSAKNVAPLSVATALAIIVLPVPGGPKRSTPFGGARRPDSDNDAGQPHR